MSTTAQAIAQTQSITLETPENGQQDLIFTTNHRIREIGVRVNAKMLYQNKYCVILLKGSQIATEIATKDEEIREYVKRLRNEHQNAISSSSKNGLSITTKDIPCDSSSQAIKFVTGISLSGNVEWKDDKGKSLKDMYLQV